MRHRTITIRPDGRRGVAGACWLLALLLLGSAGCAQMQTRAQSADEGEVKFDLKEVQTIGDVTDVANGGGLQVSGVGLVRGLNGTGGGAPPSVFTKLLETELHKQGVRNAKELLDSPENALVLVTALIPPGARKGDPIDIELSLPPGSKVTSLRGGVLDPCSLQNTDTTKHMHPGYEGSNKVLLGHILAQARGPLLVGFGAEPDEAARMTHARIWDGGVSLIDRPFYMILKNDQKFARVATNVAARINLLFPDDARKRIEVMRNKRLLMLDAVTNQLNDKFAVAHLGKGEMARAVSKDVVYVQVPYAYRLNPERYLRVARLIPLREAPEVRGRYRQRLHEMLLEPASTLSAALRLEALGKESVSALRDGLKSPNALVRFAAAEALVYLDCGAGVGELARLTEQFEELRAYTLNALASINEPVCHLRLTELLSTPDAEVRYGAFKALRLLDDQAAVVRGELLNDAFWLHTNVASRSLPLVHVSTGQRAEVAFFGEQPRLVAPFKVLAGEFTVTAERGDDRCTVGRFVLNPPSMGRRQCSFRLEDVLRTMAALGGQYPDAVELLRQVEYRKCLTAPVRFDATPVTIPVEELARQAKDPKWRREVPVAARPETAAPAVEAGARLAAHAEPVEGTGGLRQSP